MARTGKLRARRAAVALMHPETGVLMVPDPARSYDENDPLVRAFRWAFVSDEDLAAEVAVEQATAAPGELRTTPRARRARK